VPEVSSVLLTSFDLRRHGAPRLDHGECLVVRRSQSGRIQEDRDFFQVRRHNLYAAPSHLACTIGAI
jgi:hypothetical protein